jgi:hypothetical protein
MYVAGADTRRRSSSMPCTAVERASAWSSSRGVAGAFEAGVNKRVGGEEGRVRRRWSVESEGDWMPLLTLEGRRDIHAG